MIERKISLHFIALVQLMKINPILPIWLMTVLCVAMLLLKRKGIFPFLRQIFIVLLLFLINLRIMIPSEHVDSSSSKMELSVLFVVDNTISMLANDYRNGTERLTAVKEDCSHIIDTLYGADFSVLTFDNTAKILSPFTSDTDFAKNMTASIYPLDSFYAKGSSMNTCKELLLQTLKNTKNKSDKPVAVFFISDGEITNEDTLDSFAEAASYIDFGAVLGYGTKQGGKMYLKSADGQSETILQDETEYPFKDAISKINEDNLQQLADDMHIRYVNMNKQETIEDTLEDIRKNAVMSTEDGDETSGYQDIYYWFMIPLLLLLVYDFKKYIQRNM